jgi:hypothetical protein
MGALDVRLGVEAVERRGRNGQQNGHRYLVVLREAASGAKLCQLGELNDADAREFFVRAAGLDDSEGLPPEPEGQLPLPSVPSTTRGREVDPEANLAALIEE